MGGQNELPSYPLKIVSTHETIPVPSFLSSTPNQAALDVIYRGSGSRCCSAGKL